MDSQFNCNDCNKSYKHRKSLKKHRRADHEPNAPCYMCLNCKKVFKLKHHLKSHEKNCEKGSAQCTLCNYISSVYVIYEHYRKEHDINLAFDTIEVQNETEFLDWKKTLEDEDFCSFVTWRSKSVKKDGTMKWFLRCHRAGVPKQQNKQPIRKARGTNKIGGYCPAHLDITISNNKYLIKFCRTHVGHDKLDLKVLKKAKNDRDVEKSRLQTFSSIESANNENRVLESINRKDGMIHFDDERPEEILSDDLIDFLNVRKSLNHKKTLLKKQFINLIDKAEEGAQLSLITRTFKSLSDAIERLKMNLPPPLVPISQNFHF